MADTHSLLRNHIVPNAALISTPATRHRSLALLALCLAVLVAQVDTAVVNLATRPIGEFFSASIGELQWVVDSYNLVYAVLLLTGGLLADLYGRRRVFMTGAAIFTLASLLCALAPSAAFLIGARAFAGLGAAFLLPASLAIIRVVWHDPGERGRVLGIWAACNGLAMAIGPTLGGLLILKFGWQSIFLVVIPLSLCALILAALFIPESAHPQDRHFDAPAQLLSAIALGGLAFAAIRANDAPAIAVLTLLVAAVAFVLFIKVETRRGSAALVPLDIFRTREFCGAIIATAGMTFGMYSLLFLLPLTWQSTGRLDVAEAGIALMPMALAFVLTSPFSGRIEAKMGTRLMTAGGLAIIASGLLLMGLSAHQASLALAEMSLALTGLGMGLATGPLMGAAVGAVAAGRSGTASALINVARMAGATLGVAVLGAVFTLAHGGPDGLRLAMFLGGLVQMSCAAVAWAASPAGPLRQRRGG
ncbi:MFS transporter [Serratia entomophila]|uniref:MFS transporter n=1 Tax=Serratia entomophila TaxID=42906 RepID=UPI0021799617|nr:MFS transporter [Serratia entomophila]CAI0837994.1 Spectinomycin tetracycline efflux pump [Serratia entomophila]CAI1539863.1 Spectinomycin tetracycline efflux pump [Serratia entomophila]CAI1556626.1 Spectinomycin tetracycline efflux pump [Serratia entomophila]CAI1706288.1 Spectinomycin tetracycline efflux pump [Serratia entomophila]CAI1938831.1 Spectinomycin tetracycline efflux pump [Serratia entomophila]